MNNQYQFTFTGLRVLVRGRVGTIILSATGPNAPYRVRLDRPWGDQTNLWVPREDAEFVFLGDGI